MKRWLSAFFLTVTAAATSHAYGLGSGCCNWLCGGKFEVWGETLYMQPSLCDLNYAIADDRPFDEIVADPGLADALPVGKQLCIRHNYEWGGRIGVGYIITCKCIDVRLQYTTLHSRKRNIDTPDTFWVTFGSPGTPGVLNQPFFDGDPNIVVDGVPQLDSLIVAKDHLDYDAVDLELGRRKVKNCGCLWYRTWIAIHYAHFRNCLEALYTGTIPDPSLVSVINLEAAVVDFRRIWGVGPRLGIEGRYTLFCGFGIGGRFSAAVLAGESHGNFAQLEQLIEAVENNTVTVTESELDVAYRSRCVTFPAINGRLGVNYTWCCNSCFRLVAEFGYEFLSYINAISRPTFNDRKSTESSNCQSYNAHGFYLNVTVQI